MKRPFSSKTDAKSKPKAFLGVFSRIKKWGWGEQLSFGRKVDG
jgi:hypothetical protein